MSGENKEKSVDSTPRYLEVECKSMVKRGVGREYSKL
jgi:hypothetical protein